VTDLKLTDPLLASEIFGPIQLASVPETVAQIDRTPLGLYVFTEDMAVSTFVPGPGQVECAPTMSWAMWPSLAWLLVDLGAVEWGVIGEGPAWIHSSTGGQR
jgi:hypothetical protein